jgi:hypothetical protein
MHFSLQAFVPSDQKSPRSESHSIDPAHSIHEWIENFCFSMGGKSFTMRTR